MLDVPALKFHRPRSSYEVQTLSLFDAALKRARDEDDYRLSVFIVDISGVFEGRFHAYAYPAERLKQIADARAGYPAHSPEEFQANLTKMVRQKVLRSRVSEGIRLYEVNY